MPQHAPAGTVPAAPPASAPVRRIGIRELEQRLACDRSTIWRRYRSGRLPEPEYLGDRRVWRLDVIEDWERQQIARPPEARSNNLRGTKP